MDKAIKVIKEKRQRIHELALYCDQNSVGALRHKKIDECNAIIDVLNELLHELKN